MIRYRDRKKVKKILDEKYAGLYSGAAGVFLLNAVAAIGAIAMFGMVIYVIVMSIYRTNAN